MSDYGQFSEPKCLCGTFLELPFAFSHLFLVGDGAENTFCFSAAGIVS